ncbi:hypothetical protein Ate01nite_21040 [Actinoplanes teichomyceticus]|nr:hypothetical protein Ate01nite_21040 [Actinoplanes teichomyceticus]
MDLTAAVTGRSGSVVRGQDEQQDDPRGQDGEAEGRDEVLHGGATFRIVTERICEMRRSRRGHARTRCRGAHDTAGRRPAGRQDRTGGRGWEIWSAVRNADERPGHD